MIANQREPERSLASASRLGAPIIWIAVAVRMTGGTVEERDSGSRPT